MKAGRFLTVAMIVFALVVVPMGTYVGGYYGLATENDTTLINGKPIVVHYYRHRWHASFFAPAGVVEAWLTGNKVHVVCLEDVLF